MIPHEVSRTALAVAYMRAAHQVLDAKPLMLEDAVAVQLLGKDAAQEICDAVDKYQTPIARALRSHVVLRSRYTEDQLRCAIERGVSQYVIVGAGFDTFSLRQPQWAHDLQIVEVDHPGTQGRKLTCMADAGLRAQGNVKFVEIDFESETLEKGLLRNGISTERKTFFSWLGVTMYLTETAIDETLRSMTRFASGSQVVLTFAQPTNYSSPKARGIAARFAARVQEIGEPFISYFEPDALKSKLMTTGFTAVDLLSSEEAHAKYFLHAHADLPPPRRVGLASAIL